MHARSALFDLYGDHLNTRGKHAPVAALVRLLEPIGIAAPAVRTAISRMVLQGWLEPVTLPSGRGYAATDQATARLDEAGQRIYRTRETQWDGTWHLVLLDPIRSRGHRSRVRAGLSFLGYAELGDTVWVSPWEHPGLGELLAREEVTAARASATSFDPPERPLACWDLESIGEEYAAWLAAAVRDPGDDLPDATCGPDAEAADPDRVDFAHRFLLVHEWRKFLFRDPGLPGELLPADWPGREAAAHFTAEASRLKPGAERFVDRCLNLSPSPGPSRATIPQNNRHRGAER
ncbi:MAG: PaaX family transcriptional regulator [Nocardioides sp.]|nr:PaaX family transcriptional regulator [Nocardioides sp.]